MSYVPRASVIILRYELSNCPSDKCCCDCKCLCYNGLLIRLECPDKPGPKGESQMYSVMSYHIDQVKCATMTTSACAPMAS
jgi:hypothetical protein